MTIYYFWTATAQRPGCQPEDVTGISHLDKADENFDALIRASAVDKLTRWGYRSIKDFYITDICN